MRLLLDTHVLVWLLIDDDRVPEIVLRHARSLRNEIYVSAISAYEISLKYQRGFWPEVAPLALGFEQVCDESGFEILPVLARHARAAGALPLDHRDPFDRLLAAQAAAEDMPIISIDQKLDSFPVKRIWD